jgi:hypothetical protein
MHAALNSLLPTTGIGLRVTSAAFRAGADASVLVTTEIPARYVNSNGTQLELAYSAVDPEGNVHGAITQKVTLKFQPDMRAHVERAGVRVLKRLKLKPGRYQLHLAARDTAGGATGSVTADLEVPDYDKTPLSMSHVLLTSVANASIPTVRPDEETRKLLPAPPVALRTFPPNDTIALFTEIYDDGRGVPHKVQITTTLQSDGGTQYFQNDEERDSRELGGKRGGYGHSATVPLKGLAPGRYVLTVQAQSRVQDVPAAIRQIRVVIAGAGAAPEGR